MHEGFARSQRVWSRSYAKFGRQTMLKFLLRGVFLAKIASRSVLCGKMSCDAWLHNLHYFSPHFRLSHLLSQLIHFCIARQSIIALRTAVYHTNHHIIIYFHQHPASISSSGSDTWPIGIKLSTRPLLARPGQMIHLFSA